MFLVDNLLLSPFTSLLWVFKEINEAVQAEKVSEAEGVTRSLSELYMRLETGAITEEQFTAEEKQLLDRLDDIEARNAGGDAESDDEVDEEAAEEANDEADESEINIGDDRKDTLRAAPLARRATKGKK